MIYLRSFRLNMPGDAPEISAGQYVQTQDRTRLQAGEHPFNLPLVRSTPEMKLDSPVTIFVGENGTGKSTILEALAVAAESIAVGGCDVGYDPTLAPARSLAQNMKLVWNFRTRKGFFMRTEDSFNFSRRLAETKAEMLDEMQAVDRDYVGRSDYAKILAKGSYSKSVSAIERKYHGDLEERSHGESLLTLFRARFVPGGLYLLDEPESALSPLSQLAFVAMVKEMVGQDCQFIIATHSPIIMAVPEASILSFDSIPPEKCEFDDLEHVKLFRAFMRDPGRFMQHL